MKYIKKYEEVDYQKEYDKIKGPEVGDYIIASNDVFIQNEVNVNGLQNALKQIIGRIIGLKYGYYQVEYNPEDLRMNGITVDDPTWETLIHKDDIKFYSKNREDLEVLLSANKYNL